MSSESNMVGWRIMSWHIMWDNYRDISLEGRGVNSTSSVAQDAVSQTRGRELGGKSPNSAVFNFQGNLDRILEQMDEHPLEHSTSTSSANGVVVGDAEVVTRQSSSESTVPFFRLDSGRFSTHVDETGKQATRLWWSHWEHYNHRHRRSRLPCHFSSKVLWACWLFLLCTGQLLYSQGSKNHVFFSSCKCSI